MEEKKQKLLIEYLLSSPDTFALCQAIVNPEYFNPEFRRSVVFMKEYYDTYSTTPSNSQVEAETNILFTMRDVAPDEIEYCSHEIEKFCKRKGIEAAILASPQLIEDGDYGTVENLIRDAVTISLNKNMGVDYFNTIAERLQRMLTTNPTIPTSWKTIDDILYGGLSRKELLLVSANAGGGKSITLANLAFNYVTTGYNVLYISLELSEDIVAQRFDTMFSGIGRQHWRSNVSTIEATVLSVGESSSTGNLFITQLSTGTTAIDIRAYLKEFYLHQKYMPDVLIVDYLDEMNPNEFVSADNISEKDRRCTTQLRQIVVDENMIGMTASQLNRSAVGATHHDHSQIAGGIGKISVTDVYWSIVMTEAQRAAGEMVFHFQKTRNSNGVGRTVHMKWDSSRLRITDENDNTHNTLTVRSTYTNTIPTTNTNAELFEDSVNEEPLSILDLMKDTP